ncbi:MAG: sugar phosphate isomerase/epimerase [Victivallales bacterium]|nr:sugar phosphate isomerase/epimerase [Victivallales bacterium]
MNLSVMQCTFHGLLANGTVTPAKLADDYSKAGATAIEPMGSCIEASESLWKETDAAFKDHGMVYDCYDVGINLIGDGSQAAMQAALDNVKRHAEFAGTVLFTPCMMVYGTAPAQGMSNDDGRRIYGEQLRKAAEIAKPYNIVICIEDFGVTPHFTAAATHCKAVLDIAGDDVKMNFDNGNFLYGGETVRSAFALLADRTCHIHIKDFKMYRDDSVTKATRSVNGDLFREAPHGQGDADVDWTIRSFLAHGYKGFFSIEVFSANTYEDTIFALNHARTLA